MRDKKIFVLFVFLLIVTALRGNDASDNKVIFSHFGGFYTSNFMLTMTVPDPVYSIVYTIDGSNPQISATAINGGTSKTISINPATTSGRAKTPGFIVRASLKNREGQILIPYTHTYIFPHEVLSQKYPGANWPKNNVNGQLLIYDVSDQIIHDAEYKNQIVTALLDIPSISLVGDMESFFHPDSGIYVNAWGDGIEWERACNVELLDNVHGQEFSIAAGMRIRGGWSRHNDFPKHAFRLFFRQIYGSAKLYYPLFGDEGVNEFDKIDLRTSQNYAWSNGESRNTFVREVFSRDSQRDMGQPYTRSRYYHLYLNGMYWGLYQTQERSEARYAESYFGGDKEDYDVVKVNTDDWNYKVGATDGSAENWYRVWQMCHDGFESNEKYFMLEGRNALGEPVAGAEKLVDIDNLIDYLMTTFYSGNFDSPISKFRGNKQANNFYTIYNRANKTQGFIFFAHDAEHSLMTDAVSPGIGIDENRVEPEGMDVASFDDFHPQWLHHKLTQNAEYRQRFADRAYVHLFNDGVFTPNACVQRFKARANQIDKAIIAESARWGAAKTQRAFTRNDDWLPEIENIISSYFPYRTDIVINQLENAGLLSSVSPPNFWVHNKIVSEKRFLYGDTQVKIASQNSNDIIFITLDGTDPRAIGGKVNSNAISVVNGHTITLKKTTVVHSRVKRGNEWSPLNTINFIKQQEDYENLKITELNYYPPDSIIGNDTVSGKQFEFIEFKNTGDYAIDLSRLRFMTAIDYKFADDAVLQPKSFYVVASNSQWFFERYGLAPSDVFPKGKSFSNDGELVVVISEIGKVLPGFRYLPYDPWPAETAGMGYTLSAVEANPGGNPKDHWYWKASGQVNGSPFADDNESVLLVKKPHDLKAEVAVYPNPSYGMLHVHPAGNTPLYLEIYTSSGQKVYQNELFNHTSINLTDLSVNQGILLIKWSCEGKCATNKIVYRQ